MTAALAIPTEKQLRKADRSQLIAYYQDAHKMRNEWIRRQVIENDRIDILAIEVLGLQVQPFHLALMQYQFLHPENLQLCFRGAGKTTTCTVVKVVHLLLKNPNLRILIASKTLMNAQGFLKEVKGHFESNERLAEIFGPYYDPKKVGKWDEREIEVLPRTSIAREASVTAVGVEGTVVSKHYDVIISDDLVDEDNSRTKLQRDKTRTWFYNTLMPTLEPPDPKVPHRGEHHMLGTRYHYDDLYGHLIANELAEHHQIIPALDENGRSPWPEKYPAKWFAERRRRAGLIIFNCQYQCFTDDTEFLTEDGWRRHHEVGTSRVATFDAFGRLVFQVPTKSIREKYDGEMVAIKGHKLDAIVTPNHQMIVAPAFDRGAPIFKRVDAANLDVVASKRTGGVVMPGLAPWVGNEVASFRIPDGERRDRHGGVREKESRDHVGWSVSMDAFLKFVGYFVSEGSTSAKSRGGISLSQNDGPILRDMKVVLLEMGFASWSEAREGDHVRLEIRHIGLWEWLRENVKTCSGDARLPRELLSLSARQLRLMFDAMIAGDGHVVRNVKADSFQYTSKSKPLVDDVSELAIRIGLKASVAPCKGKDAHRALIRQGAGDGIDLSRNVSKVHYKGDVVCFTVPNGTLITRRNGKTLLSGNCDTEAMKGEIFQYDHCQQVAEADWPDVKSLRVFMGVDLAISEDEQADKFAIVVIGVTKDRSAYYVLDYYENQLRFKAQTAKIVEYYRRWRPIRVALETNQYQDAQRQTLKDKHPDMRLKKVQTDKDKITRAWKLSSIFEDMRVYFRKGIQNLLIEHLVLFPNHKYKDLFDAFDLAVSASKMKRKRGRRGEEPGVI